MKRRGTLIRIDNTSDKDASEKHIKILDLSKDEDCEIAIASILMEGSNEYLDTSRKTHIKKLVDKVFKKFDDMPFWKYKIIRR